MLNHVVLLKFKPGVAESDITKLEELWMTFLTKYPKSWFTSSGATSSPRSGLMILPWCHFLPIRNPWNATGRIRIT